MLESGGVFFERPLTSPPSMKAGEMLHNFVHPGLPRQVDVKTHLRDICMPGLEIFKIFANDCLDHIFWELEDSGQQNLNILVSSLSVALSTAIACQGASVGSTVQTELQTICGSIPENSIQFYSSLVNDFCSGTGVNLKVVHGVFSAVPVSQQFSEQVREFGVDVHDFKSDATLVNWEMRAMQGLVKPTFYNLKTAAQLAIASSSHFKGSWSSKFSSREERSFEGFSFNNCLVPFIGKTDTMDYAELPLGGGIQACRLPYSDGKFSALFILPQGAATDALLHVVNALSAKAWDDIHTCLQNQRNVNLWIPTFKLDHGAKSIREELTKMGARTTFTTSQFDRLASGVCLSDIYDRPVVEVSDSYYYEVPARKVQGDAVNFTANSPFIFAVEHTETGAPLFIGLVGELGLDHP